MTRLHERWYFFYSTRGQLYSTLIDKNILSKNNSNKDGKSSSAFQKKTNWQQDSGQYHIFSYGLILPLVLQGDFRKMPMITFYNQYLQKQTRFPALGNKQIITESFSKMLSPILVFKASLTCLITGLVRLIFC